MPGEAVHAWDIGGAVDVSAWLEPLLIEGLYDGMNLFCYLLQQQGNT